MTFYCLTEPGYGTSNWHKHIIDGLSEEIKSKRYELSFLTDTDALASLYVQADDIVLLIGSDTAWIAHAVALCSLRFDRRIVVLGNVERGTSDKHFSIVSSDISRDITALFTYLKRCGKKRLAMYGINPHSASDRFRKNAFLAAGGKGTDVFENSEGLEACFCALLPHISRYEGVICANDFCAISLVRHIEAEGLSLPFIVSCGETVLAKHTTPSITNLQTNYTDFGHSGIRLARLLLKNEAISTAQVFLKSEIVPGASTDFLPTPKEDAPTPPVFATDDFYADGEVDEMLKLEKLLCAWDETDQSILRLLLNGKSYTEISDALYLSVNGIKYKLKRLLDLSGLFSKDELINLLSDYGITL